MNITSITVGAGETRPSKLEGFAAIKRDVSFTAEYSSRLSKEDAAEHTKELQALAAAALKVEFKRAFKAEQGL